jgi:hypothetical protein
VCGSRRGAAHWTAGAKGAAIRGVMTNKQDLLLAFQQEFGLALE